jgi:hypothetical protein
MACGRAEFDPRRRALKAKSRREHRGQFALSDLASAGARGMPRSSTAARISEIISCRRPEMRRGSLLS